MVVAGPAARAISHALPELVAWAAIELIEGPLSENPRRIGHRLGNELTGNWSARRGDFRIVYLIDDERREATVMRVDHRRDVYRS